MLVAHELVHCCASLFYALKKTIAAPANCRVYKFLSEFWSLNRSVTFHQSGSVTLPAGSTVLGFQCLQAKTNTNTKMSPRSCSIEKTLKQNFQVACRRYRSLFHCRQICNTVRTVLPQRCIYCLCNFWKCPSNTHRKMGASC